ncbi:MAG: alpha/beta hydrolase [Akkermansiaceae bacterium]
MSKWKKYLLGEWSWSRPLKSLAFIYLTLLVVALAFSNKLIFPIPPAGYNHDTENISILMTPDGTGISTFYFAAEETMPTILWSHGNAEDIGYLADVFNIFIAEGFGIFAYDYPGYGISEGEPSEEGCYTAVQTAWDHMTTKLSIPKQQIIVYGQSVGSGPATWLVAREEAAALVLVAPFLSAFRVATRVPIFPNDPFKNIHEIKNVEEPLLVIHGDQDKVIAQWHGKKLYHLHSGEKTFISIRGAGHNDIYYLARKQIVDAISAHYQSPTSKKSSITAR